MLRELLEGSARRKQPFYFAIENPYGKLRHMEEMKKLLDDELFKMAIVKA